MKYALVCPNELVENGYRIADVCDTKSWTPAEPTYWLECEDDVMADWWYFNTSENRIKRTPVTTGPVIQGLEDL